MNKFIVNNILIEKSERDIQTGKSYDFTNGFNLICGNNEAGKSSIMNFLKESFFLEKGTETGKIFFQVDENGKKYRADIKPSSRKSDRCVLVDEDNNSVDYSFVEEYIKQNYFKAGFTINLDDLNSLESGKIDLVNVIKDPLNDKLGACLKTLNNEVSASLGVDFKPKKEVKDILTKIESINNQINELSQKEGEYNSVVEQINELNSQIDELKNIIKYLKLSSNLKSLEKDINDKKNELNLEENNFNEKLFENRNKSTDLFNRFGKYEINKSSQDKNKEKIEKQLQNIKEKFADLMFEYGLAFDEDVIKNIQIDNSKNSRIKELVEQNKEFSATINVKAENKKLYQNEISRLSNVPNKEMTIEELKQLKSRLELDCKTYNHLRDEIESIDKKIQEGNTDKKNTPLLIGVGVVALISIVAAFIAMMNKISNAYIIIIFVIVLVVSNLISWKSNKNNSSFIEDKTRKNEQKDSIFAGLKQEINKFYSNIDINSIVQIEAIENALEYLIARQNSLIDIENELSETNKKIEENKQEFLSLKDEQFKNISDDKYLDVVAMVTSIKDEIKLCDELKQENLNLENENSQILEDYKAFIVENNLNITNSIDFKENAKNLIEEIDKNTQIKTNITNLKSQIEQKEKDLQTILDKDFELINKVEIELEDDIEQQIKQKEFELEQKESERNKVSAEKINLEKFEGIADKKVERNLLLAEYRQIVKNLMANQMTLNLVEVAKSNFNQTQPDLVNAQKYLSILTGGKYSKINLELQEISNEDNSLIKQWNILSRGTKEQLYLALRLGYASNYSIKNNKPSLPLIIDDAFVNFDVIRTKNALECLKEFAKTNQVLFFTCHTEQMKMLLEELKIKEVNVISI